MTVTATTLDEATTYAMQNIFDLLGSSDLIARADTWVTAFDELDQTIEEQRISRNWIVPTIFATNKIPTGVANQLIPDIQDLYQIVTRSLDCLRNLSSLTAGQITNILAIYNAAWT